MNYVNFGELKDKISDWSADDEDVLLRKLKSFTENYTKRCEDLQQNLESLDRNINLIDIEYFNSLNSLKIISIKKFVEHVVDNDEVNQNVNQIKTPNQIYNPLLLSKEERENNLLNKFKNSISKSLENLNIKNLLDVKPDADKDSILEDDNVSVTSSKYFATNISKGYKNIKLPFIIGTNEFFNNAYLGISPNDAIPNNGNVEIEVNNIERRVSSVEDIKNNLNIEDFINTNTNTNYNTSSKTPNIPTVNANVNVVNNNGGKSSIPAVPKGVPKVPVPFNQRNIPVNNPPTTSIPFTNNPTVSITNNKPLPNPTANLIEEPVVTTFTMDKVEEKPLSIKEQLMQRYATMKIGNVPTTNPVASPIEPISTERDDIQYKPITNTNQIVRSQTVIQNNSMRTSLAADKGKQGPKLDQFIKKSSTLFNNDDDEEEDNTGLFRKSLDNRFSRTSLFDDKSFAKETKETKQESVRNNSNMFEDSSNAREYRSSTVSNSKNKIIEEDKNLEKAKNKLIKIFEDEDEDDETTTKINEKSNQLNNKLSLILGEDKKKIEKISNDLIVEKTKLTENTEKTKLTESAEKTKLIESTLTNEVKPALKRKNFFDDEDEIKEVKPPVTKDKFASEKRITIVDPLSNSNTSASKKGGMDPLSQMAFGKKDPLSQGISRSSGKEIIKVNKESKDDVSNLNKSKDFKLIDESKTQINLNKSNIEKEVKQIVIDEPISKQEIEPKKTNKFMFDETEEENDLPKPEIKKKENKLLFDTKIENTSDTLIIPKTETKSKLSVNEEIISKPIESSNSKISFEKIEETNNKEDLRRTTSYLENKEEIKPNMSDFKSMLAGRMSLNPMGMGLNPMMNRIPPKTKRDDETSSDSFSSPHHSSPEKASIIKSNTVDTSSAAKNEIASNPIINEKSSTIINKKKPAKKLFTSQPTFDKKSETIVEQEKKEKEIIKIPEINYEIKTIPEVVESKKEVPMVIPKEIKKEETQLNEEKKLSESKSKANKFNFDDLEETPKVENKPKEQKEKPKAKKLAMFDFDDDEGDVKVETKKKEENKNKQPQAASRASKIQLLFDDD